MAALEFLPKALQHAPLRPELARKSQRVHADDAIRRWTAWATARSKARPRCWPDFFVTDIHGAKEDEIEATPDVGLVLIDSSEKAYLSITGRACVVSDAEKTKAAWRKTGEVWWPGGPNDPDVCLLRIEPFTAELWD